MIFHYVNLVCWEDVWGGRSSAAEKYFADTLSFWLISRWCGYAIAWTPGSSTVPLMELALHEDSGYFLTPFRVRAIPKRKQFVLPKMDTAELSRDLCVFLDGAEPGSSVFIGISSPKQNAIARLLSARRSDCDFYCVGAVLANFDQNGHRVRVKVLSGTGFEWLLLAVVDPRRALGKIIETAAMAIRLLTSRRRWDEFRALLQEIARPTHILSL